MATAVQKITSLACSRDIPFNKLVLAQENVRRVKAGISIEDLADDIAYRGLLQNLNVRPVLDAAGQETSMYAVPAGGRRYPALELLVRRKRLAKTAPVPCNVREADSPITAEDDSHAENVRRIDLHPLDQFRAFQRFVELGQGVEEIAARHFVTPVVVRQRLRLAAVSPKLLDVYAEDGMTVDNYLGRVTKGRILEAVREAKGEQAAQLIDHLKKAEMAREAERLLVDRWTAILSIVLQPPRSEAQLRKNPLGIYVNSLNWSRELGSPSGS